VKLIKKFYYSLLLVGVVLVLFAISKQSPNSSDDIPLKQDVESFGEAAHDPIQEELDVLRRGLITQVSMNMSINRATKSLIQEMAQLDEMYTLNGLYVSTSELRGYPRSLSYDFDSRYGTVDIKYTVELANGTLDFSTKASFRQIGATVQFEYMDGDIGLLMGGRIAIKYIDENEFFVMHKNGVRLIQSLYIKKQ
jgi:hypothetical protein